MRDISCFEDRNKSYNFTAVMIDFTSEIKNVCVRGLSRRGIKGRCDRSLEKIMNDGNQHRRRKTYQEQLN